MQGVDQKKSIMQGKHMHKKEDQKNMKNELIKKT